MTMPPNRSEAVPEELLPCPFCGSVPSVVTRNVEPQGDPWYGRKDETFVLCDCGACLFDGGFHEGFWDAETRAAAAWNRRASPPPPSPEGGEGASELTPENRALINRAEAAYANAFPHSTTPACRHAAMIGEYLLRDGRYVMLEEEPQHCGESILLAVALLWESRVALRAALRPEGKEEQSNG